MRQCVSRNQNHHEEYLPDGHGYSVPAQFPDADREIPTSAAVTGFSRFLTGCRCVIYRWYWWHPVETDRPVRWITQHLLLVDNESCLLAWVWPVAWCAGEAGCQVDVPVPVSGAKHFPLAKQRNPPRGKNFPAPRLWWTTALREFYPFLWPIVVHNETVACISHCLLFF